MIIKKRFISLALAVSVVAIIGLTITVGDAKIVGIDLGAMNACVAHAPVFKAGKILKDDVNE